MTGRRIRALTTFAALSLLVGCSALGSAADPEREPHQQAADKGEFWVDPDSEAARQVREWEDDGRADDARTLRRIADQAVALWPSDRDPGPQIRRATKSAEREDRTAVLVAYNIPHRDCGQYSAGGAADAETYLRWIEDFANGIGDHRALVVLEPDAVPHLVDGCTPRVHHQERTRLLGQAIDRLKKQPRAKVYLDAGNPSWITETDELTEPLRRSGVTRADGFALNVSNFQDNRTVIDYGRALSKALDNKPFVVDTSRNGSGPLPGQKDAWCNPPGRALGKPPTTRTGEERVDAYLWIKVPGESDGECRGGPAAGDWWPEYALALARNTAT